MHGRGLDDAEEGWIKRGPITQSEGVDYAQEITLRGRGVMRRRGSIMFRRVKIMRRM